jgi:hypothetical protein
VGSNSVPNESQKEMLSESDLTYVSETKEVVFLNGWDLLYENETGPSTRHSYVGYGSQFEGSSQLLAYVVDTRSTHSTEKIVSVMRNLGLMVLEDYPYCHYNAKHSNYGNGLLMGQCVIVGTYDEIRQLFDGTAAIEGTFWQVYPAPRPDIADYIKKYSDGKDMYQIYDDHYGEIKTELGDAEEIMFSVSVILPQ